MKEYLTDVRIKSVTKVLQYLTIPHLDLSQLTLSIMGSGQFWLKAAEEDSKSIPPEFPRFCEKKATEQCMIDNDVNEVLHLHVLGISMKMMKKIMMEKKERQT